MIRFVRPKRLVVLVIVVCIATSTYSLHKLIQGGQALSQMPLDRLWVVSQAEFEYQRLLNALDRHALDQSPNPDDVQLRLEILWSRLLLTVGGRYAQSLHEIENFQAASNAVIATLESLEPEILALPQGNWTAYAPVRAALIELGDSLHNLVVSTMLADEKMIFDDRRNLAALYWALVGNFVSIVLSGGLLVLLLFLETRRATRFARQAAATQEALRASENRYRALYDENPSIFLTMATNGILLSVNQYGAQQLGYKSEALIGSPESVLHLEEDRTAVGKHLAACFERSDEVHRWETRFMCRDGSTLWMRATARVLEHEQGPAVLMVCEDITDAYTLSQQLSYQASHDALTGLVNRREFEKRLERILKTVPKDHTEHALCYMDLDQFKVINDTCGHVAGDELLRRLGELLTKRLRTRDTVARLGGDEFGILMEHCSIGQARRVADTLLRAIEDFRFFWEDRSFRIGVSIGLVPVTEASGSAIDILKAADTACYAAKDDGRNRVHVYREDNEVLVRRHGEMQWVARINHALEEERFHLSYQPIIALANHHTEGNHYELLIRMEDETGKRVSPGAFLPAAERYNLAPKLDRWVVRTALEWLRDHPRHLQNLFLCSINLSGQTLGDEEFLNAVIQKFAETKVPAQKICFEITETAAISSLTNASHYMKKLKELGCCFALDDFGSGLSSFAYLKTLPVEYLKIDGVFVKDILDDPIDLAMVRSINEIAHVMGKQTIAEFVEEDAVLNELQKIGVDYAQGYGIGRPSPIEEMAIDGFATSMPIINNR